MTRRRAFDWVLIVALVGSWAVLFARAIDQGVRNGRGFIPLVVSSASAGGFPKVLAQVIADRRELGTSPGAFLPGDRLLAVDGQDLRERSALYFYDRATRIGRERGTVQLLVDRGGVRLERKVELTPSALWWVWLPYPLLALATGVFLLVRAPAWHLARQNLVMLWGFSGSYAAMDWLGPPRATAIEAGLSVLLLCVGATLMIWIAQGFTASARPVPRLQRAFALAIGLCVCAKFLLQAFWPLTSEQERAIPLAAAALPLVATVAGYTRSYRRSQSLERRQIRWVLLGHYVAVVGAFLAVVLNDYVTRTPARMVLIACGAAVPVGMLISVIGYRWLDIDRVISAAASYTLVGIAVLGAALALLPRVATAAAPALGIDPAVAQWLLTMALVLATVPAYLYLRPRVDRQMFPERHQRMSGLERLHDEVGRCSGAEELWQLTSERLEALLAPESLVVYAREGDVFSARFTRGGAAPPYAADSLLVRALERRGRPLAADSAELDPFDRAALETLGVALVVPMGTREGLLGFASLGRKRSGDIYTREETAQLAAIASRSALVLRPPAPSPELSPHIFRREGELWKISSQGKEIRVRDTRGFHYLATLLREPGREFHVNELVHVGRSPVFATTAEDPDLRVGRGLGNGGERLDARARAAYRARLLELDAELADAERRSDLGARERAGGEREALLEELTAAARGPRTGSDAERARVAVTKAIGAAIDRIAASHPELGAHLSATIRRGYFCAYVPDPRVPAEWEA